MRIHHLIVDLDSGGAEWQLARLAVGLRDAGCEVRVTSLLPPGEAGNWLKEKGIPVDGLGITSPGQGIVRLPRLIREIRGFRPDILHTWMFHANVAGALAGRVAGVPVILGSLRVAEQERPSHLAWERRLAGLRKLILCNSKGVSDHAANHGIPPEKLQVIGNDFDASLFPHRPRVAPADEGPWKILFLGRLHAQKGVLDLIEAMAILCRSRQDITLCLVGNAPDQTYLASMEKMVAAHHLANHILIRPACRHEDIPGLMREHHLLVLPSLWEGMPNVIMEAFATGLPVVATDIPGTRELVTDGETGRLVHPGDPSHLAAGISLAMVRHGESLRMAARARDWLIAHHHPGIILQKYLDTYRQASRPADGG